MDGRGLELLVDKGGVKVETVIKEGISKSAERLLSIHGRPPHQYCSTFVCRLNKDVVTTII